MNRNVSGIRISMVVVSDYEGSDEKTWQDERAALQSLAEQSIAEPFEVILVENTRSRETVPDDLDELFPGVRLVFSDETQSAKLKDFGVRDARGEYIAVMEADCLPDRGWLQRLVDVLDQHPEFDIASGRTHYGDDSSYKRSLALLDRSFDNYGKSGESEHVSNNGAVYRRQVLESFPYPEGATPFLSSRLRIDQMRAAGHRFYFHHGATMRHAIGGLGFVADFRRHTGFADMASQPHRRYGRIPRLMLFRLKSELRDCRRLGRVSLKWYDWPLLAALYCCSPLFSLRGMLDAVRDPQRVVPSAYR